VGSNHVVPENEWAIAWNAESAGGGAEAKHKIAARATSYGPSDPARYPLLLLDAREGGTIGQPIRQNTRPADFLLAAVIFTLYLSLNIATLHRYGITQDEPEHWFFGDRYLQFYLAFGQKALDFSGARWPAIQTWPVGPTLAALTAKLFSERLHLVGQIDGHHLASITLMGVLLSSVYLFLAGHAGRTTAGLSCLALVTLPRIWGDAHNNSEDIPHLVFYSLSILTLLHGMLTQRPRWILASGVCWGLALGTKINALSLPLVTAPMLAPLLRASREHPAAIKRALAASPIIALLMLWLAWPYFWYQPFDRLMEFWAYLLRWGYGSPTGWQGSSALNLLITTPLSTLGFALIGIVTSSWIGHPLGRRVNLVLLAWLLVPILRSSLPGILNYNVIRRFMEFAPALAIFAGIGGASLIEWATQSRLVHLRRWAWVLKIAVLVGFLSPVVAVWRYFPYESTYYNPLIGGLGGAQSLKLHESTDYTLSSYREGLNWLNTHADPSSFVIVPHGPHLITYYPLRKDLVLTEHLWMDELPARGQAVYLMYVTLDIYTYNMCLTEAFLRPEYEIRRDGGILLRVYKLSAESNLSITRNALPPPQLLSATFKRRWVTLSWQPTTVGDIVGHIIYYGRTPGRYEGSACVRGKTNQWEVLADVPYGTYYISMSVLTQKGQESERSPDMRIAYYE